MLKLVSQALLDELAAKAAASPRARAHHNIHATPADLVQRFLVVAQRDSYFRPHRHATRAELALLLRGHVDVLIFDDAGSVLARHTVGAHADSFAYETPQGVWHTLVPAADGCAFLEVKEGPYDPATAAEFAAWAPPEGDAAVPAFRAWLRKARPGDTPPG
jgi:cupin fold WbuC family metalloprotein